MLILGSASPRRKEILSFFELPFRQEASHFDEDSIPFTGDPRAYALQLAREKGKALLSEYPKDLILTADTVVYCNGRCYGKPSGEEDAMRMMSELSGKQHSVFTALALLRDGEEYEDVEETKVFFHDLSQEQIRLYQQGLHCADKAGGYAIQGAGGLIVRRIEGCYYNVMGLPINALQRLLKKVGIDLFHCFRK
jgi:septum formation protein